MASRKLEPIHPGEVLASEFLEPLGLSQYRLAQDMSVPPRRINEIVHGKRAITADTALRLARYFGTSERFWLNLQARYDLEMERDHLGGIRRRHWQQQRHSRAMHDSSRHRRRIDHAHWQQQLCHGWCARRT